MLKGGSRNPANIKIKLLQQHLEIKFFVLKSSNLDVEGFLNPPLMLRSLQQFVYVMLFFVEFCQGMLRYSCFLSFYTETLFYYLNLIKFSPYPWLLCRLFIVVFKPFIFILPPVQKLNTNTIENEKIFGRTRNFQTFEEKIIAFKAIKRLKFNDKITLVLIYACFHCNQFS